MAVHGDVVMNNWRDTMAPRIAVMTQGLDLAGMTGLEIGPLCYPIVRHSEGDVTYVDYTDTETLRQAYANRPVVDVANLVDVDVVWGERTLLECMGGRTVDYAIASHVAEHVPDLITWLAEMRDVLKPGGELRLALPDRRFSHDALRQESRLSDLLTAYVIKARRPQIRDVMDFRLHTATGARGYELYAGLLDIADVRPDHSFEVALNSALYARDHPEQYFDVHCLAVQAGGFARLMAELAEAGAAAAGVRAHDRYIPAAVRILCVPDAVRRYPGRRRELARRRIPHARSPARLCRSARRRERGLHTQRSAACAGRS